MPDIVELGYLTFFSFSQILWDLPVTIGNHAVHSPPTVLHKPKASNQSFFLHIGAPPLHLIALSIELYGLSSVEKKIHNLVVSWSEELLLCLYDRALGQLRAGPPPSTFPSSAHTHAHIHTQFLFYFIFSFLLEQVGDLWLCFYPNPSWYNFRIWHSGLWWEHRLFTHVFCIAMEIHMKYKHNNNDNNNWLTRTVCPHVTS